MTQTKKKWANPCSDCTGLKTGTRSNQDPHQYLMEVSREQPDPLRTVYECLLCGTGLTKVVDGFAIRWI